MALPLRGMMLIPMDEAQSDHLKAYGLVYRMLEDGHQVYWLLNYRGGSFATDESQKFTLEARVKGIVSQSISAADWARILQTIENANMEKVTLEKPPAAKNVPAKVTRSNGWMMR